LIQGISGSLVKSSVTGVMRTGQEPLAIETGFLDDDNSPDFAVATFDGYIDYYLSKSNRIQSIFVGDRGPTDVKLRDMNLDGNVDIITNDWTNDRIHVYYLSASGAVIRQDTLSVPNSSGAISIAITNANGLSGEVYPDIVVANEANDRISLFINQRGLGFQYTTDFYVGLTHPFFPTSPREIHAGDLNDDGIDDLVIANRIGGVSVVINRAGAYVIRGLVVGDPREFSFGQRAVASSSGSQLIRSSSFSIDVSGDGQATPLDALMVINELNRRSQFSNRLVGEGESSTETSKFDVNLDGYVTPLDILIVINHLNWINQRASGNRTSSTANLGTSTGFSLGQSVDFYAAELTGDLDLVRRRLKIASGK